MTVGISILTNKGRTRRLKNLLDSFFRNTQCPVGLAIGIFCNGVDSETDSFVEDFISKNGHIDLRYDGSQKDKGCAFGTNRSMEMVKDCKYQLHLESDFQIVFEQEPQRRWLLDAIELLDKGFNYVYLRRMRDDKEATLHWWHQWYNKMTPYNDQFVSCPGFWWSNNPAIFNYEKLKELAILPLDESLDGPKGTPQWSQPELQAGRIEKSLVHRWGVFLHEYDENENIDFKGWNKRSEERMSNKFRIIGFDNGNSVIDFENIVRAGFSDIAVLYQMGVSNLREQTSCKVQRYSSIEESIKEGDIAFFPKIGLWNAHIYKWCLENGVPVVVKKGYEDLPGGPTLEHEKNGFLYIDNSWARHWLTSYINNDGNVRSSMTLNKKVEVDVIVPVPAITVITPTCRRDPRIVKRLLDCMKLQTFKDFEQIVCSDGGEEPEIKELVKQYSFAKYATNRKSPPNSFGNYIRSNALELCNSEYVCFVDDDNIVLPTYLEKLYNVVSKGNDFAVCHVVHFGPLNEKVGPAPKVLTGEKIELYYVDTLQFMVRTAKMKEVGWQKDKGYLADGYTFEALNKISNSAGKVDEVLGFHM